MAKVTPITEQFQHFVSELKRVFGATCKPTSAACIIWWTPTASYSKKNLAGAANKSSSRGTT